MARAGRPKEFERGAALAEAAKVFWQQGYAATSMDDLGKAMGLNRPSIYNTFGNKEALYRESLALFCGQLDQGIERCIANTENLQKGLIQFFEQALEVYCSSDPNLGCLMMCTAPAEAINVAEIKADFSALVKRVDKAFESSLQTAIARGELTPESDAKMLAMSLQATLHSIALRSRAGDSKQSLKKYTRFAVAQLPWSKSSSK